MKITFIYPDLRGSSNYKGYFYTGIAYLSAVLKQAGYTASLIHVTEPISRDEFICLLKDRQPDLLGFSSTTNMFGYVETWARWIKEYVNVPIVCGGVHPTLCAEEVICNKDIDIVCVGEGEEPLVGLCDAMERGQDFTGIRNLWVKRRGKLFRNSLRPLIEDLDRLPFPDRALYDYTNLYHEREGRAVIMASRGCPCRCSYCCNHVLRQTFKDLGPYVRFRSVDNVITEIRQVIKQYPFVKGLAFDDDILPLRREWLAEFAAAYSQQVGLPFTCNIYPTLVNKDTVNMLRTAGCTEVHIGIESGNERIRNEVLNRHISNEKLLDTLSLCKKEGLRVYTYNMVGIPSEGMREMLDTVKLNAKYSDVNQTSIFFPYKGTKLYETCKEKGLLTAKSVTDYFRDSALSYSRTKLNQILFIQSYFRVLVRIYSFLGRRSGIFRKAGCRILDCLLCSRIAPYLLFPLAIATIRGLYKHKHLYRLARLLKRKFLDS